MTDVVWEYGEVVRNFMILTESHNYWKTNPRLWIWIDAHRLRYVKKNWTAYCRIDKFNGRICYKNIYFNQAIKGYFSKKKKAKKIPRKYAVKPPPMINKAIAFRRI